VVRGFTRSLVGGTAAAIALSVFSMTCAERPPGRRFSVPAARAHVDMLAGTLGIRAVGTQANQRAREYLVGQLQQMGFQVHIQEADAARPNVGQTARVANIVGVLPGTVPDAVALVAHYDSTPDGPGAADDALGVAVCLEVGRALAASPSRHHAVVIALTDAEEIGLMGAVALLQDPAWQQVRAYLNFEAVGTTGASALFETGPGNTWLVKAWAANAVRPFGGSFATEIYKRLSNDTDFTILKRSGVPGLNFAPAGNSYAYHTPLDTPARLADETLRTTGETAVGICEALDAQDLNQRSADSTLFFDVGGLGAVAAGSWAVGPLAVLALIAAALAWIRMFVTARRTVGIGRLIITALWGLIGVIAVFGLMVAAAWGLRAAREVYHPWYAHPDRFFALLVSAAVLGWWGVGRLGAIMSPRVGPHHHPAIVWCGLLGVWMALAAISARWVPAASYLLTVPLAAAGLSLLCVPARRESLIRLASLVPWLAAWLLWGRLVGMFGHFLVPMFGRLPVITPVYAYPAFLLAAGLFVVAPCLPVISGLRVRRAQPSLVTIVVLAAFVIALSSAYLAPAYSTERPMYRAAQYIEDTTRNAAFWEIGGNEPGLDLELTGSAPHNWSRVTDAAPVSVPMDRPGGPFRFRAPAQLGLASQAEIGATVETLAAEVRLEVSVRPPMKGAAVVFYLPPGIRPRGASLPGVVRGGRWRAIYVAPSDEGVTFRVALGPEDDAALEGCRVAIMTRGLPGGTGALGLPPWMPQDRVAWRARSVSILPVSFTPRGTGTRVRDTPVP
jgi:Peptidase family M28